ncbi:MAG: type II/IV secretion system protein, partial [Bdellovibrionales bacterium]|nr:type II/IV secretion system protein [Bdellovibrionales bacterium]
MVAHDVFAWQGERSQVGKNLRNLLGKLGLIHGGDKTFDESPDDHFPIKFYANHGFFKEEDALSAVAQYLDISITPLSESEMAQAVRLLDVPPLDVLTPSEWRTYRMLPLDVNESNVTVAVADPLDIQVQHQLQFALGRKLKLVLAPEDRILEALNADVGRADESAVELIVKGEQLKLNGSVLSPKEPELHETNATEEDPEAAPVVRLLNKILSRAIFAGASDLHLIPTKEGLLVKARIDGIMQKITEVPDSLKRPLTSRLKLLCGMNIAEKRKPQDGRLRMTTKFGVKDLRISSVPSAHGENIVARILSPEIQQADFSELGMNQEVQEALAEVLKNSARVNLVTGPTGSGKSSSLYACLLHLNNGERNIITIEDPIEYRINGVTQIQVNPAIQFGFADGLRSILRQDPDVVLVGEVRDEETASIVMKAAQTGHLVLSTLHTNTAPSAVTRLRDLGVPSYLISSSIGSIMAQRLARKLCLDCSTEMKEEDRDRYGLPSTARQANGCKHCRSTGYRGRTGIYSLLVMSDELEEAIRNEAGEDEIERIARRSGYYSLDDAGRMLVEQGITSVEEIERVLGVFAPMSVSPSEVKESARRGAISARKILLIEDDVDTRAIFSTILQQEMFEVIEAA